MRFRLVPVGHGRIRILQRQIGARAIRFPPQRLDRHLEVMIETDRIDNVPSVLADAPLR